MAKRVSKPIDMCYSEKAEYVKPILWLLEDLGVIAEYRLWYQVCQGDDHWGLFLEVEDYEI